MKPTMPLAYELKHVDTDWHKPFKLTRALPLRPAPIIPIHNCCAVYHSFTIEGDPMVQVVNEPEAIRIILPGDW